MSHDSQPTPILEVRDLSVTMGGNHILTKVNLQVQAASIHALLGPNGAGKTTLIRSLTGSLPHKGEIRFSFQGNGLIGYVPQLLEFDHSLPMTVSDFMAIMLQQKPVFLGTSKATRTTILSALQLTGCAHLVDRMIGGLSGGELRRVLLAQALVPTPEILLLDEPASNIDELGARAFEQTLINLRDEHGISILMVGHDLATIMRLADQATGIKGSVTWTGPAPCLKDPAIIRTIFGVQAFEIAPGQEVIA